MRVQRGREEPLVEFGEVERHAVAEVGQGVEIAPRDLAKEPLAAELGQVVGEAGRGAFRRIGAQAVDEDGPQIGLGGGAVGQSKSSAETIEWSATGARRRGFCSAAAHLTDVQSGRLDLLAFIDEHNPMW